MKNKKRMKRVWAIICTFAIIMTTVIGDAGLIFADEAAPAADGIQTEEPDITDPGEDPGQTVTPETETPDPAQNEPAVTPETQPSADKTDKKKEKEKEPETPTYTVKFVDDKGVVGNRSVKVKEGKTASFPSLRKDEKYKADNGKYYFFDGWFSGGVEVNKSTPVRYDMVIEARWTKAVKITFDAVQADLKGLVRNEQGVLVQKADYYVRKGEHVVKPEKPQIKGYDLENWYYEAALVNPYKFDAATGKAIATAKEDRVVYARYLKVVKVAFDTNGSEDAVKTQKVRIDKKVSFDQEVTRKGYTLKGWYIADKSGDETAKFNEAKSLRDQDIDKNITLKAKWTPITYAVSFDANGGAGIVKTEKDIQYSEKATIRIPDEKMFSRTGYEMTGWTLVGDDTETVYKPGKEVKLADMNLPQGKKLTLQAHWKANTYSVNFDANAPEGKKAENEMKSQEMTYDEVTALQANDYIIEGNGYTFKGWALDPDAQEAYYLDQVEVMNLTTEGEVTLYAVWADEKAPEVICSESSFGPFVTYNITAEETGDGLDENATNYTTDFGTATVALDQINEEESTFTIRAFKGQTVMLVVQDLNGNATLRELGDGSDQAPNLEVETTTTGYQKSASFGVRATDDYGVAKLQYTLEKDDQPVTGHVEKAFYEATGDQPTEVQKTLVIPGNDDELSGEYSLIIEAIDAAGQKTAAQTITVLLDNTAPTVSFSPDPDSEGFLEKDQNVTVTIEDELSTIADGWTVAISGATSKEITTGTSSEEGKKIVVEIPYSDFQSGDNTITVTAEDAAGNDVAEGNTIVYKVDQEAPEVTISPDTNEEGYLVKDQDVTVTIEDQLSPIADGWKVIVSGDTSKEITTGTSSEEGKKIVVEIPYSDFNEGTATITVTAEDENGNAVTEGNTKTYNIDKTAPKVASAENKGQGREVDGQYYYSADTIGDLEITIDEDNLDSAVVKLDGETVGTLSGSVITVPISQFTENATNTFTAELTDKAGNTATIDSDTTATGVKKEDNSVSFVYDTTAPQLTSVDTAETAYGQGGEALTGDNVDRYDDVKGYYYQNSATVTFGIDEACYSIESGYTDGENTGQNKDDMTGATLTLSTQGTFNGIYIKAEDNAGNKLVVSGDCEPAKDDSISNAAVDGKVTLVYSKSVDKEAPVAAVAYESDKIFYVYSNENEKTAYVSGDVNYKITITEDSTIQGGGLTWKHSEMDAAAIESAETTGTITAESDHSNDKAYAFTITGCDRAGRAVVLDASSVTMTEAQQGTGEDTVTDEANGGCFTIDTIAPTYVSQDFTPLTGKETYDENNRAYYGKHDDGSGFSGTYVVTEANGIDADRMNAGTIGTKDGRYCTATPAWSKANKGKHVYQTDGNSFTWTLSVDAGQNGSNDGVYRFVVWGEDKAGNGLVKADNGDKSEAADTYNGTLSAEGDNCYWSYNKVLDTVVPTARLKVGGDYYKIKWENGTAAIEDIQKYDPFRKESSATIDFEALEDEKSPCKLAYTVNTTSKGGSKADEDYTTEYEDKVHKKDTKISAEAQFYLHGISVIDRAGNEITLDKTNIVYLDKTNPQSDITLPVAVVKATSSITKRCADGRNLYNTDVKVKIKVKDPNAYQSSSGLKQFKAVAYADGKEVDSWEFQPDQGDADPISVSRTEPLGKDAKLQYEMTKTITIKKGGKYETNDIEVRVFVEDNAGNGEGVVAASTKFGIDSVGPKITISYDNNSAQNGKYFKASRTATVTVIDRNVDNGKISIKTQVGVPNAYSWSSGGGNGANDKWVKKLNYTKDGDYTLGVSGTDALGNPASVTYTGTAPREFTIDKTSPVITVTFNNNSAQNGKYYKNSRTATVTVKEHNFRASDVKIDQQAQAPRGGSMAAPGVSGFSGGDVHSATIVYNRDGTYSFKVNYTDLAGNPAQVVVVPEFVIDQTAPTVRIEGLENGKAYSGAVPFKVIYDDDNFGTKGLTFKGVRNGESVEQLLSQFLASTYGGEYVISDIAVLKQNDDIYTIQATVTDLAGNSAETPIFTFSVNRFGSTWDYNNDDETEGLVKKYYTKDEQDMVLREVNINRVKSREVTLVKDGDSKILEEGKDFKNVAGDFGRGGYQYVYTFDKQLFEEEGNYDVVVNSVDEAGHHNSNTVIHEDGDKTSEVPVRFAIDKTVPVNTYGGIDLSKEHFYSNEETLEITPEDNMQLAKVTVMLDDQVTQEYKGEELAELLENPGKLKQVVKSKNDWQIVRVVAEDAAGNVSDTPKRRMLVTRNIAVQFFRTKWLFFGSLAVIALLVFALIMRKRMKDQAKLDQAS